MLVTAACAIQLRGNEDAIPASAAPKATNSIESDLARCRAVTSEQTDAYEHCHRIWAENRRRFFGRRNGAAASVGGDPPASPEQELRPKDQSRMPQGHPSITTPEADKP
jgi:conjugative transfer region protein TrbK